MNVQVVSDKYLHKVWDEVEPYLESAMEHAHGEDSTDQIKVYLSMNALQLIVFVNEQNSIEGAATVKYITRANDRVAFVTAIGGKLITDQDAARQFLAILRNEGATVLEGAARPSIVRLWRKVLGAREKYSIVEVQL